jgi:RNA polymerase sigma-70 factor (ECF subfamily)
MDLPDKQREVFIMRDIQNLSMKEVQQRTGLGIGSIKTNLYLARKRIRELLDPEWWKL